MTTIRRRAAGTLAAITLIVALCACGSSSSASGSDAKSIAKELDKAIQENLSGNVQQAQKDYEDIVKKDPKNTVAYYNLGLIAQNANRIADAENFYRLALTTDPNYEPALYNFGILRSKDGDIDGAIDFYRHALAQKPKDANALFNLGLLLRKTGRTAEGNTAVQNAVKLNPALKKDATAEGVPIP